MVVHCCIKTCSNSSKSKIKMHYFPTRAEYRDITIKWIKAADRLDLMERPSKQLRSFAICDIHFDEEVKIPLNLQSKRSLKVTAIPTLFLNSGEILNSNDAKAEENIELKIFRRTDLAELQAPPKKVRRIKNLSTNLATKLSAETKELKRTVRNLQHSLTEAKELNKILQNKIKHMESSTGILEIIGKYVNESTLNFIASHITQQNVSSI